MEGNNLIKKGLAIGVILLLIVVVFTPNIGANIGRKKTNAFTNSDDKLIKIAVYEYKSDDTIGKNIVSLPLKKYVKLIREIKNADNLDDKLSLCKEYQLIPQDVTSDKLRAEMEKKARRMNLNSEKLEFLCNKLNDKIRGSNIRKFHINAMCRIDYLLSLVGVQLCVGIPPPLIIWFLYEFINSSLKIPIHIFLYLGISMASGIITSNGIMGDVDMVGGYENIMLLLGFTGYYFADIGIYPTPFITFSFITFAFGYAVLALRQYY